MTANPIKQTRMVTLATIMPTIYMHKEEKPPDIIMLD